MSSRSVLGRHLGVSKRLPNSASWNLKTEPTRAETSLRARFVLGLDAIGVDARAVADALASGDLTLGYVEFGGRRPPRSDKTFVQLSEEIDISFAMLERLYVAFGLSRPMPDEYVREEDLRLLKIVPLLFGAGCKRG